MTLRWYWEMWIYGVPVYSSVLLIPSYYSSWWNENITPYLLAVLSIWFVFFSFKKIIEVCFFNDSYLNNQKVPLEKYLGYIQNTYSLHFTQNVLISDSIKHHEWSTIKLANMLPGAYKFIFDLEEDLGSFKIDNINIVHSQHIDRFLNHEYDNKIEESLIVDAGEVLLFSGSLIDSCMNNNYVLSRKLADLRKLIKNQFIIITSLQENPEGFIALPFYGDGDYKVKTYLINDRVFAISININIPKEDEIE
jgi:hypothetical protein